MRTRVYWRFECRGASWRAVLGGGRCLVREVPARAELKVLRARSCGTSVIFRKVSYFRAQKTEGTVLLSSSSRLRRATLAPLPASKKAKWGTRAHKGCCGVRGSYGLFTTARVVICTLPVYLHTSSQTCVFVIWPAPAVGEVPEACARGQGPTRQPL